MNFDVKHWVFSIGGLVALGVAIFCAVNWLGAHDEWVKAQATIIAKEEAIRQHGEVIAKQEKTIAAIDARIERRDAELARVLAQLADVKRSVQSPAQVAAEIGKYLPALPSPVRIEDSKTEPGKKVALVPEEDWKAMFDRLVDCQACEAKLQTADAKLADLELKFEARGVQLAEKDAQLKLKTEQLEAAMKAAKGGGFWRRTGRALKWVAVGVGIGIFVAR